MSIFLKSFFFSIELKYKIYYIKQVIIIKMTDKQEHILLFYNDRIHYNAS